VSTGNTTKSIKTWLWLTYTLKIWLVLGQSPLKCPASSNMDLAYCTLFLIYESYTLMVPWSSLLPLSDYFLLCFKSFLNCFAATSAVLNTPLLFITSGKPPASPSIGVGFFPVVGILVPDPSLSFAVVFFVVCLETPIPFVSSDVQSKNHIDLCILFYACTSRQFDILDL